LIGNWDLSLVFLKVAFAVAFFGRAFAGLGDLIFAETSDRLARAARFNSRAVSFRAFLVSAMAFRPARKAVRPSRCAARPAFLASRPALAAFLLASATDRFPSRCARRGV
jgi:hypothetical protein